MKKVLLLGAMAFLAINIATIQTSNAQNKTTKAKTEDELKMEKEKNQLSTATAQEPINAVKRTTEKDVTSVAKEGASVNNPKISTEVSSAPKHATVETTSKPQTPKRLKANQMSRTTAAPTAIKKAANKTTTDAPTRVKNGKAADVKEPLPSSLKPQRPKPTTDKNTPTTTSTEK